MQITHESIKEKLDTALSSKAVTLTEPMTDFDKYVYIALSTLFQEYGKDYIPYCNIVALMNYWKIPYEGESVSDSIDKMFGTELILTEGTDGENGFYREKIKLLSCSFLSGDDVKYISLCQAPPLLTFVFYGFISFGTYSMKKFLENEVQDEIKRFNRR